jgi:hypothetical protein
MSIMNAFALPLLIEMIIRLKSSVSEAYAQWKEQTI